jgi:YHS domain-containing protein
MEIKKTFWKLMVITISLLMVGCASANRHVVNSRPQTICPVMGGNINKDIFADYDGKRVYFCCKGCIGQFSKYPARYVKKLEDEGIHIEQPSGKENMSKSGHSAEETDSQLRPKKSCGCCS